MESLQGSEAWSFSSFQCSIFCSWSCWSHWKFIVTDNICYHCLTTASRGTSVSSSLRQLQWQSVNTSVQPSTVDVDYLLWDEMKLIITNNSLYSLFIFNLFCIVFVHIFYILTLKQNDFLCAVFFANHHCNAKKHDDKSQTLIMEILLANCVSLPDKKINENVSRFYGQLRYN